MNPRVKMIMAKKRVVGDNLPPRKTTWLFLGLPGFLKFPFCFTCLMKVDRISFENFSS